MKKIIYLIIPFILFIYINACSGYKPIFSSSNLQFKIADYSIKGDKKLGNKIYSKLYNLSNSNKNNSEAQNVRFLIDITINKSATVKNSAGKILEYKINLNSNINIKNFLTDDEILNQNIASSSSYRVQSQYSETIKLENKTIEILVNKIYQDLLIRMSENLSVS